MKLKALQFRNVQINPVIRFLIYSDILIITGWGLITPIMAVFFTEQVVGGDIRLAGLAATVYFFTKSVLQIPVARFIDLHRGENDDFWVMIIGSFIISAIPLLYIFVTQPWQVYLAQFLYGIGAALSYPTWLAVFSRHLDRNEEGLEWSLYFTSVDLGTALAAGLGALIISSFGYTWVFIIVSIMSLFGNFFLWGIKRDLKVKVRSII